MNAQAEESLYLVIYQFGKNEPLEERIKDDIPTIQRILDRLSRGQYENVFYSSSGDTFGYVIQSRHWARYIASQIEAPGTRKPWLLDPEEDQDVWALEIETSPFKVRDQVHVFELSYDHAGINVTRLLSWIERNDPR